MIGNIIGLLCFFKLKNKIHKDWFSSPSTLPRTVLCLMESVLGSSMNGFYCSLSHSIALNSASPTLVISSSGAVLSCAIQTCGREPCPHFPQNTFYFIFNFLAMLHGMQDPSSPNQRSNLCPRHRKWSLNHWTTREIPPNTF